MNKILTRFLGLKTQKDIVEFEFNTTNDSYTINRAKIQGSVRLSMDKIANRSYVENRRSRILESKFLDTLKR